MGRSLDARRRWGSPAGRAATRFWSGIVIASIAAPFGWALFTSPYQGGGSEGTFGWALGQVLALAVLVTACALAVSGMVRTRRAKAATGDR